MYNSYLQQFNYCQWRIRIEAGEGLSLRNEYFLIQYYTLL